MRVKARARSSSQELARKRNEELVVKLQTGCLEERLVELLLVHWSD